MGEVFADITLKNAVDVGYADRGDIKEEDVREVTVTSVVDTGAFYLCITEDVCRVLGLKTKGALVATLANDQSLGCTVASPVRLHWQDRSFTFDPVVIPDSKEVLMGVFCLEALDLIVDPKNQKLIGAHGDKPVFRI